MDHVLSQLRARYPDLRFVPGEAFMWSPSTQEVIYKQRSLKDSGIWSLLHETSHALLGHETYGSDFELIKLEAAAWERAKQLASELEIVIDEDHIQDCLDTYRDWIYARSICPRCATKSIQQSDLHHYRCFNCHEIWRVTPSRFCRAYRATNRAKTRNLAPFDILAAL